ncbi:lipase secretion chaperone [Parendozoicomonas haliclonae]|uniref:Lipase chaperone n=1 Tax=Parendozoicomonas haliclonae TaxID=1960125 RepID=A0A1X7AP64_9GAMM|nr:lipase secretion chaperone [Parendozoicomonas haliclonae]SMA50094.1 lipase chaperone [Parendozoicomonas haliclonae]
MVLPLPKSIALLLAGLLVTLLAGWLLHSAPSQPVQISDNHTDDTNTNSSVERPMLHSGALTTPTQSHTPSPQIRSLRGTSPDGSITVDEQGNIFITAGMRRLFEYYLATLGEQSLSSIRQQFYQAVKTQHNARIAQRATDYLDQYINYRVALAEQQQSLAASSSQLSLSELFRLKTELLTTTRLEYLGAEMTEAFYGDETLYDQYMQEKLAIQSNSSLSADERSIQQQQLAKTWPQFAQPAASERFNTVQQQIETAKEQGASPNDIYVLRSQAYGTEAAERLTALDKRRHQWQTRLDHYQQQKQQLLASGFPPGDSTFQNLIENSFSGPEQHLVLALEKTNKL